MNPDRNKQFSLASLGELRFAHFPIRKLLVVSVQNKKYKQASKQTNKTLQVSFQPLNSYIHFEQKFHVTFKFSGCLVLK